MIMSQCTNEVSTWISRGMHPTKPGYYVEVTGKCGEFLTNGIAYCQECRDKMKEKRANENSNSCEPASH